MTAHGADVTVVLATSGLEMAKHIQVQVGQLYRGQTAGNRLWQVEFVYADGHGIPHARLRDVNQQSETITFAAEVLSDQSRFKLETA